MQWCSLFCIYSIRGGCWNILDCVLKSALDLCSRNILGGVFRILFCQLQIGVSSMQGKYLKHLCCLSGPKFVLFCCCCLERGGGHIQQCSGTTFCFVLKDHSWWYDQMWSQKLNQLPSYKASTLTLYQIFDPYSTLSDC